MDIKGFSKTRKTVLVIVAVILLCFGIASATVNKDDMVYEGAHEITGTLTIPAGSVDTDELAAEAVTTAKIEDDAVTAAKIVANAVGASEIDDDVITATQIAANAVASSELGDNAAGAAQINFTVETITIAAPLDVGTATVTSGAIIIGHYPTNINATSDLANSISISSTTLTLTTISNVTDSTVYKVIVLEP